MHVPKRIKMPIHEILETLGTAITINNFCCIVLGDNAIYDF